MHTLRVFVSCLAISALSGAALGQGNSDRPRPPRDGQPGGQPGDRPGGGDRGMMRPNLSPEKAKAAWELEATSVAKHHGLKDDQTRNLVKSYTEVRTKHDE